MGIKGIVSESTSGLPIQGAAIKVRNVTSGRNQDIDHDISTIESGEYWRLLTPGQYEITAQKTGYEPSTKMVTVGGRKHQEATKVDFVLQPSNEGFNAGFYPYNNFESTSNNNNEESNNPNFYRLFSLLQRGEQNVPIPEAGPEQQIH